jgi:hypothetical protein
MSERLTPEYVWGHWHCGEYQGRGRLDKFIIVLPSSERWKILEEVLSFQRSCKSTYGRVCEQLGKECQINTLIDILQRD